ncbi:MAG: hypothetical protein J4F34_02175 [Gemmatimonadetes bacterium]|nr:hypothetical protein [Gemmatimonadota bacterium]
MLLGTAEAMEQHGNEELALALLRYLASRFPDTESGRVAASRAESTKIANGAQGGETELKVWGATYGIWLGVATPIAFDADNAQAYGAGLLLGGPTGFLLGRALANSRPMSLGQARAITWGGTWGGFQGLVFAAVADFDSSEGVLASMILGSVVGVAGGLVAAQQDISPGTATSATLGSLWGTWFGVAGSIMADLDEEVEVFTVIALTGNAGLAAGAVIGSRVPLSRPRARMISVGGLLGTVGAAGLAAIAEVESDNAALGLMLTGGVTGLVIAMGATSDYGTDEGSRRARAGEALLNRHGGEWFVATPLPSPVAGLVARGPGAGERTVSWRVPLLSARF